MLVRLMWGSRYLAVLAILLTMLAAVALCTDAFAWAIGQEGEQRK
jgi:hypothetical protein